MTAEIKDNKDYSLCVPPTIVVEICSCRILLDEISVKL